MDLDPSQADLLAGMARARSARLADRVIPASEMAQHLMLEAAALPFGEFDGAPVRFEGRWWRPVADGWEPLDQATSQTLDADLERWQAACAAIGGDA